MFSIIKKLVALPQLVRDYFQLRQQLRSVPGFPFGRAIPIVGDRLAESGVARGSYFHQDLYVARRIFAAKPERHVDIGSRVDGFVAHVASFREIEVFDIRPTSARAQSIVFRQANLMKLDPSLVAYCDSVSSLSVIEHFGLGRYGDPIDAAGHLKGLESIYAILRPGGTFYLSVPIGSQRINFNAHRVFSVSYLLGLFQGKYSVEEFSFTDDAGDFHESVPLDPAGVAGNFGCGFGHGIFILKKLSYA